MVKEREADLHGGSAWSSRSDTGPEGVEAIQAGLTVRLIITDRSDLMTCSPREEVPSLAARNGERYSFIPAVREENICGLHNAERWVNESPPPDKRVEEDFEALSEGLLIGSEASLLDLVRWAIEQPAMLVVSRSEIVGLVCLADLQKLPVRSALLGVVTALEMVMAEGFRLQF